MSDFACCFWWLIAGLLLGWLLAWLFDKLFRRNGEAAGVRLQAEIETLNVRVAELTARLGDSETRAKRTEVAARAASGLAAAAAFGYTPQRNGQDDLELIEGIGPKISDLLKSAGLDTFAKLAAAPVANVQQVLDAAGPNFRLANPESWARQAALCARNDWAALRKLQDELVAGVDPSKKIDE
jgi:predicted flap endonuclease-1-like 5' DNA nuclease